SPKGSPSRPWNGSPSNSSNYGKPPYFPSRTRPSRRRWQQRPTQRPRAVGVPTKKFKKTLTSLSTNSSNAATRTAPSTLASRPSGPRTCCGPPSMPAGHIPRLREYPISKPSGWPSTACGRRWDIVDVCDEDPTVPCPRVADGVDRVAVLVRGGALELWETLTPVNTKKPGRLTGRLRSYG